MKTKTKEHWDLTVDLTLKHHCGIWTKDEIRLWMWATILGVLDDIVEEYECR